MAHKVQTRPDDEEALIEFLEDRDVPREAAERHASKSRSLREGQSLETRAYPIGPSPYGAIHILTNARRSHSGLYLHTTARTESRGRSS